MLGNGVVGILSETCNKWERRSPLTPAHCAHLLHNGKRNGGRVTRIILQPSSKRIYHDALYEEVGCEVSEDLSECGLIVGVKQPKIMAERATLFDYELIVGDDGKRKLAFGKYAGRAGMIDFLHGLGHLSQGAQEIFNLLPHTFVDPSRLPQLFETTRCQNQHSKVLYGCVVTSKDMVEPKEPNRVFDKADYYSNPEGYSPIFHKRIAPYASAIVNCMYWERKFPRLLTTEQLEDVTETRCSVIGIADITCDIGGSIEFVNQTTTIDSPFFRFDPKKKSYHNDNEGDGVICSAVEILPTEFPKEASQHFGNILSEFMDQLASTTDFEELPPHLRKDCIVHKGALAPLYEYIDRLCDYKLPQNVPD